MEEYVTPDGAEALLYDRRSGLVSPLPPKKAGRKDALADFELGPLSLVGSWFHRLENDDIVWQGQVVGEVQAGAYLLQVDVMEPGAVNVQRLVDLRTMMSDDDGYDWRFYDSEHEATAAYAAWQARA